MPAGCTANRTRVRKRPIRTATTSAAGFIATSVVFLHAIITLQHDDATVVHALTTLKQSSSSNNGISSADSSSSNNIKDRLLILGLGRVGSEVAAEARKKSFDVVGTVRSLDTTQTPLQYHNNDKDAASSSNNNIVSRIPFSKSAIRSVLPTCSHILISIPPPMPSSTTSDNDESDKTDNNVMEIFDMVAKALSSLSSPSSSKCSWLGLISTTGVYGNHDGATVTEESNCYCGEPDWNSPNSAARLLRLEQYWQEQPCFCHRDGKKKKALNIFRCAGIYGPTRSALHTVYKEHRQGRRGRRERQEGSNKNNNDDKKVFSTTVPATVTNRIHQVDIARAIVASMMQHGIDNKKSRSTDPSSSSSSSEDSKSSRGGVGCQIYNLADDQPETREVVLQYAQSLLEPFFEEEEEEREDDDYVATDLEIQQGEDSPPIRRTNTSRRRRRQRERKIVANDKLKTQLLSEDGLLYPTYKEGLASIVENHETPWWQQRLQRQEASVEY